MEGWSLKGGDFATLPVAMWVLQSQWGFSQVHVALRAGEGEIRDHVLKPKRLYLEEIWHTCASIQARRESVDRGGIRLHWKRRKIEGAVWMFPDENALSCSVTPKLTS